MRSSKPFISADESDCAAAEKTDTRMKQKMARNLNMFGLFNRLQRFFAPQLRFSRRGCRQGKKDRGSETPEKSKCTGDAEAAESGIVGNSQRTETGDRS